MNGKKLLALGCAALLGFSPRPGHAESPPAAPPPPSLRVAVTILPQQYFVQRIGGARVQVEVLVLPGQNHATYEPTARQMARFAEAQAYFLVGAPVEKIVLPRLRRILPNLRIVDTREGLALQTMTGEHDHAHGAEEDCDCAGPDGADPHIWLSPSLVVTQALTICRTLVALDPAGRDTYEANCHAFTNDLQALHARLTATLAPCRGRAFMVFHPSWGYFARTYGLRQIPIEAEGKSPSARQLARIVDRAREEQVRVIFVQPQFDQKYARAVADGIGGTVVSVDPLALDYIANLETAAQRFRAAILGK